jgi:uncharacterized membrane protein YiaA
MKDDSDRSLNDKVDTVMVFKGNQGLKKSTFFAEILPSPNLFSDSLQRIETNEKDASTHMLNYWLIEFAELDGLVKKSSIEALKGFITRRRERFRPPYGRTEINARRPSILVGTTNSDQFLNDPSGSRRFWAIELTENKKVDIEYIRRERDQIWAQAVEQFLAGGDYLWWLDDDEQIASDAANEKFKKRDPWDEYIETYLSQDPTIENGQGANVHGFRIQSIFEDVQIIQDKTIGDNVFITIKVVERPRLSKFSFKGDVKKTDADEIRNKIMLMQWLFVTYYMVGTIKNTVKDYYSDKGYYFSSLLLVRWIESIFNKNKKASIDNWTGNTIKSKLLVAILHLDFAFTQVLQKIGIKMYGLSCYCICKK